MHPLLAFLLGAITVLGFAAVLAAAWLGLGEPIDEHWPVGLDEEPTLNVTNGIGDSRPIHVADPRFTAEGIWAALESEPGFNHELEQARRDIAEGRGTPFHEVRRIADRLSRMAAGYFG